MYIYIYIYIYIHTYIYIYTYLNVYTYIPFATWRRSVARNSAPLFAQYVIYNIF